MAEFAQKRANSAIATLALCAKLCKAHTCNIFAQGKFDANSFFRRTLGRRRGLFLLWVRVGRRGRGGFSPRDWILEIMH